MEINNYNQSPSTIYQQVASEKSKLTAIDKNNKSTFEKNDSVDSSNDKNTQRDEESKKNENAVSLTPGLANAKEELSKNGNLTKLLLQTLM